jgi:DNA-binding transcriptional regulator of glucitol operon
MQFLRRHQFLLCFLVVLVLACVMVTWQFLANQSAHVELREDFILLQGQGETKPAERLYQMLIQELPDLNDKALVEDLQRTGMLVDQKNPATEDLVWKLHVSVNNELQRRSQTRIARALARAEKK